MPVHSVMIRFITITGTAGIIREAGAACHSIITTLLHTTLDLIIMEAVSIHSRTTIIRTVKEHRI